MKNPCLIFYARVLSTFRHSHLAIILWLESPYKEEKSLWPVLQVSLTRSPPSESEGSDGRFLISYDRTLVIKEVSSEDIADMHSNLSNYHQVRRLSSFTLALSSLFIA